MSENKNVRKFVQNKCVYSIANTLYIPHQNACRRFIKFQNILANCEKSQVKHLQLIQRSDPRSTYGRNCLQIKEEAVHDSFVAVPVDEEWRIQIVRDILDSKIPGFTSGELDVILKDICVK